NLQAKVLATLVPQPPARPAIAIAYVDSTYGAGLKGAFADALGNLFMPPLSIPSSPFPEGTAGSTVVGWLQMQAPEIALIVADSDAPTWVAALNDGGAELATTQFLFTDGSKAPTLFGQNPSADVLMRILGTAPATPSGPAYVNFAGSYMGK